MASNLKVSQNCAAAQAAALVGAYTNSSMINIYDGAQPVTPETPITTQNLLVSIPLPSSAAFAQAAGVMTASAISNALIAATGTAGWFRWFKADGVTSIADGSVGISGADLNLNSVSLVEGTLQSITSFTYTVPSN